ncbi:MAG TPA: cytochrome P450, partial [Chthonomonadaceae bacterium]|nr:cytochrome P450 [Chthonomonadaceae bacterium]
MARYSGGPGLFGMAPLPPGPAELRAERALDRIADLLIDAGLNAPQEGELGLLDLLHSHARREPRRGGVATSSGTEPLAFQEAPQCPFADQDSPSRFQVGNEATAVDSSRCPASAARQPNPNREAGRRNTAADNATLRGHVKTFLGAGYESSALTLTWAFLMLARRPDLEAALRDEARRSADLLFDAASGTALPIATAIVKESLRLFPPLWMTGREAARRTELAGISVMPGTLIMTSQWALQRRPALFDCPDDFQPERWLDGRTAGLHRFAFFPFGGGPRVCIGASFAMMETVLLLASIARRFRLAPLEASSPRPWPTMTLRPPPGIRVRLESHYPLR